MVKTRRLRMIFHTPAFLGNAHQSAQWRTPPLKAQLRQWWRVAYAAKHSPSDITAMREAEGALFGHAWLKEVSKSKVRIRLGHWHEGTLKAWERKDPTVKHPNVSRPVGSQLYLGYGALKASEGTALKANAAIQAGEENTLVISYPAYPEEDAELIEAALALMHRFGTVGGRSRNGWGSYSLEGIDDIVVLPKRPWQEALKMDWPHAIGKDDKGPLIWQTGPFDDWQSLMKALAVIKIDLRTQFAFSSGNDATRPEARHWLSYPVTHHSVKDWGKGRLPNSLRFKIRPTKDGKLLGDIFHMPCLPPAAFHPDPQVIKEVWQKVHAFLDGQLTRLSD